MAPGHKHWDLQVDDPIKWKKDLRTRLLDKAIGAWSLAWGHDLTLRRKRYPNGTPGVLLLLMKQYLKGIPGRIELEQNRVGLSYVP